MKKVLLLLATAFVLSQNVIAQNVGIGTNDPKTKLDISGGLSLREGPVLTLANGGASGGANDNIVLPDIVGSTGVKASFYRIAGPTAAFSLFGIIPLSGADGQLVTLVNTTSQIMTIKNNAAGTAAYGFKTLSGSDLVGVAGGSSVTIQYNKTDARWYVTGSQNFTAAGGALATGDITTTNNALTLTNNTGRLVGNSTMTVDVKTNDLNQKGIVPGPTGGNGNQVWGTDNAGAPAWQKVNNSMLNSSSITINGGTGVSVSGSPVALGGTVTVSNTAPDQTVVINSGTGISASGTYPNFTINNTGDLSSTNEAQTLAGAGATDINLTQAGGVGGGSITLQGAGATSISRSGNTFTINSSNSGGTVTNIATGTGLTGGPITSTGTIALANTTVTAGSYTNANVTIDAQGRVTAASNGTAGTVTGVTGSNGLNSSGGATPDIKLGGTLSAATSIALNSNNLSFTGTGNVGIGTAAPLSKLQVRGGKVYVNQLATDPSASYAAADLVLGDNVSTRNGFGSTNGSHIFLQSSDKSTITALDESNDLGQISYQNLKWTIGENIGWGAQGVRLPALGAGFVKSDASGNLSAAALATADLPAHTHTWSQVTSKPAGWLDAPNLTLDNANFNNSVPSGFYQQYSGSNAPTAGTWYNMINVRHNNTGNDHGFQIAASYYDENIWTRTYQGGTGSNNGTFTPWRKTIHTGNIAAEVSAAGFIPNNGSGDWQIASSSNATSYSQATLELRETNFAGAGQQPPRLGFHWSGVVASQIGIESSGRMAILNNPGTGYENLIANNVYAAGTIYPGNTSTYLNSGEFWHPNGRILLSGNLHIDSYNGNGIYMNYYTANGVNMVVGGGNVGVGTASPNGKLEVASNIANNGVKDGIVMYQQADNTNTIQTYIDGQWANRTTYAGGCCNKLLLQPDIGEVGIRNTNPGYPLDVTGTIRCTGDLRLANGTIRSETRGNFYLALQGDRNMVLYDGSAVWASNTSTSDIRTKTDICPLEDVLPTLKVLSAIRFRYKPEMNWGDDEHIGVIAQEIVKYYPDMVYYDKKTDRYLVYYDRLSTLLLKGIQEQQAEIEKLQAEKMMMRGDMEGMKGDINQLKASIETLQQIVKAKAGQ